jgi:iron complex outermembrane recepter protein
MKLAFLCGASAAAVTIAALGAPQALAQTGSPATANENSANQPPVVVVTAEKRSQNIEHVPVAVTAFTGKQREVLHIETTQQLSDFTPGLSYFASNDRAYIRGIGRNTVSLATESGVATYYNGVYYGANATIAEQHDTLFVGQIEVDRGPQNTLHGSNADGGTLNYISVRPTNTFYAEGRAGVGNYGYYYGEAVVSGPITDWLRFRVGGNYSSQNGGFFNNLDGPAEGGVLAQANNGQQEYFEAQLDANFGSHLDAWAMVSGGDYDTSFHTADSTGTVNDYEIPNASLSPSGFYAFCALNESANVGCAGGQPIVPGSVVLDKTPANLFPGNNPSNSNIRDFIQQFTDENRQTHDIALATIWTYHLPAADLKYTGGFQKFYYDLDVGTGMDAGVQSYQLEGFAPSGPFGPLTIFPGQNHTSFIENEEYSSNELSLSSTTPGPFQWIAGLYWYHEHYAQPVDIGCLPEQAQLHNPDSIIALITKGALSPAAVNPGNCLFDLYADLTYNSYAGYAQGTWQIDPQWKLEGAVRYTDDEKYGTEEHRVIEFDDTGLVPVYAGAATPAFDITQLAVSPINPATGKPYPGTSVGFYDAATGFEVRDLSDSWNAVTGEITLNWQPNPDTLAYAKYSRGYKTGGFNAGYIAANPVTAPEYVDALEIGGKENIGSTIQINGAAFFYNYQNDQQPLSVQNPATGTISSLIFNIPSVHDYGVELEAVWRPIEALTLMAQYSYLSATVYSMNGQCVENTLDPLAILPGSKTAGCGAADEAAVAPNKVVNLVGSHLPETPPNKISLSAVYVWRFDPGNLSLSASYIWKDQTYGSVFNNPESLAPAYSTVNLSAQWDDAHDRYTIRAWVNNLFNTTGYDIVAGTQYAPGGPYDLLTSKSLTFPLTVGGEIQVRFR